MQKKNLIVFALLIVLVGLFLYPKLFAQGKSDAVGISLVSANPNQYLGNLTMAGVVGALYPEDNVFYIMDEGGCCEIPILVPFTAELQQQYEMDATYSGTLPAMGDKLEVSGTLAQLDSGDYMFTPNQVFRNGEVILKRVN